MPQLPTKAKRKGLDLAEPSIKEIQTDCLIVGGGAAGCGSAVEAVAWADKHGVDVLLVEKAALERSGALAQGLSAINTYIGLKQGHNTVDDYTRMVHMDLMHLTRDDLVFDVGRHVDDSVHMFEEWGLPIWVNKDGKNLDGAKAKEQGLQIREGAEPVRTGSWQCMINGESYKRIMAEAAKNALGEDRYMERIFICKILMDANEPNRVAGVAGINVRENEVVIIKANAVILSSGGCVNVYRTRSQGEGEGRAWYPVWNAGTTYALAVQAGAETTMMENRFVPTRFKDGYGPVGAWFLLFKAKATNGQGEVYLDKNIKMIEPYEKRGYAMGKVMPTCLRNHMMIREMRNGNGPIFMDTPAALANLGKSLSEKERKHLEAEAWEDFLDMTVSQANVWACNNIVPEKHRSEIMPTEPYLLGSHSGCCGMWVSGPDEDWVPEEYKIRTDNGKVYNRMTTVNGLFTCGDGVGASGHKYSSGSFAEGRIAAKAAVRWCVDHKDFEPAFKQDVTGIKDELYAPWYIYKQHAGVSTDPDVNPYYITPANFMKRLMKVSDEYGGGTSTNYTTNKEMLEEGIRYMDLLEQDSQKLAAKDLHELMRCWEQQNRLWTVRMHMLNILFREETRYPGFYYRSDNMGIDDKKWRVFTNGKYDVETGKLTMFKRPLIKIIPDKSLEFFSALGT
ncbi:MAG: adenylyl-sulfate reductase subunit alpha [Desulfovermiculus sp.]